MAGAAPESAPVETLSSAGAGAAPLPESVPSDLPRTARPLHYRIEVVPDAANLVFSGSASIDVEVFEHRVHGDRDRLPVRGAGGRGGACGRPARPE